MRAYSQDIRDRVLAALGRGERISDLARRLEVGRQFVYDVRDRLVLEGERSSHRVGGYRQSVICEMESTVRDWIKAEPDLTLEQLCERLALKGKALKVPALWHQLNKWGLTFKKNPARQRAATMRRAASPHGVDRGSRTGPFGSRSVGISG
jgi:transposase